MLMHVRTSVNLPDALLDAARERAADSGRTVTQLIEEGLRRVLTDQQAPAIPQLPTDGLPQGRLLVDVADGRGLWDALDESDARPAASTR